jgi:SAM-dependent methyltransferase
MFQVGAERTGSVNLRSRRALRSLISISQRGRFGPFITPQTTELSRPTSEEFASGRREFDDGLSIFERFDGAFRPEDLAGREVLDLGCGYGGRTIFYAKRCGARLATGVEIDERMVERCRLLADRTGTPNVKYVLGFAEALAFEPESFDSVVSFDLLEHVRDPRRAFMEIERVLRPGGTAWVVFPSYLGARSSHLDYLTQFPALHRVFHPETIVEVVNEFLSAHPERYRTHLQPKPTVSTLGRLTLPALNGLTLADARSILGDSGLLVRAEVVKPILEPTSRLWFGPTMSRAFSWWQRHGTLPELLIGSIALRLEKPGQAAAEG